MRPAAVDAAIPLPWCPPMALPLAKESCLLLTAALVGDPRLAVAGTAVAMVLLGLEAPLGGGSWWALAHWLLLALAVAVVL